MTEDEPNAVSVRVATLRRWLKALREGEAPKMPVRYDVESMYREAFREASDACEEIADEIHNELAFHNQFLKGAVDDS